MTRLVLRGDAGDITLPGLLISIVLSLIVLSAVLDTFAGAQNQTTVLTARNDNQQTARAATDQITVALRNLASPTPEQPQAIDRAGAFDLIFQNVDPAGPNSGQNLTNVRRERWCLGTNGTLYAQRQTWTTATVPPAPATTACPGTGWAASSVVLTHVTNTLTNPARPLFTYDAAALTDIADVHVDLFVDEDLAHAPPEVRVASGVFLRNQNRRPVAAFTAVPTAQGVVLNASASADPESQPLSYTWLDGTTVVATGVTATYRIPAGSTHAFRVTVQDPAGLTDTAPSQSVTG